MAVGGAKCPGALAHVARPAQFRCVDTRKFGFKLHHAVGARVVKVVGVRERQAAAGAARPGHHARDAPRLPKKRFVVRVVATQNTGSQLISTRVYHGCKKTRPRTRAHHHA